VSAPPVFVVVGHVNRGKSSVVSTLAADETAAIDMSPGTTQHCRAYPMRVDGELLYTLVDTPGFERARHVLAWLEEQAASTAERPAAVRRFVETFAGRGEFDQECELLQPILDGGAILYVVDVSIPFSPTSEAEAEILRWTGRPRMALLNPIGTADHSAAWRPVLEQYFSVVRVFDAHQAGFGRRLGLLRTMRELADDWRPALERAIEALDQDHERARQRSAEALADALVDMLTHVETLQLQPEEDPEPHRAGLSEQFYAALREREQRLRSELRAIYAHRNLEVEETRLEAGGDDLFDLSTWSRIGLSRAQIASGGGAAGAALGGTIDLAAGGASLLLGTALGAAAGLASSWWAFDRLAGVKVFGAHLAGPLLKIGPLASRAFPWVVLGRALAFQSIVSTRAHAARGTVRSDAERAERRLDDLPSQTRSALTRIWERLRKAPSPTELDGLRGELVRRLDAISSESEARERDPAEDAPRS
jgi:hypothetical protein